MGKMYSLWYQTLKNCTENTIKLTFDELEQLIKKIYPNKTIPKSAADKNIWQVWWNNNSESSHSQCRAWRSAGFLVDLKQSKIGEYITFVRE